MSHSQESRKYEELVTRGRPGWSDPLAAKCADAGYTSRRDPIPEGGGYKKDGPSGSECAPLVEQGLPGRPALFCVLPLAKKTIEILIGSDSHQFEKSTYNKIGAVTGIEAIWWEAPYGEARPAEFSGPG